MRIGDPDIDLAAMGKSMGAVGIGPVTRPSELQSAIDKGIETAMNGGVCVVDARVLPGYDADG
jgi:ribosomal protein S5